MEVSNTAYQQFCLIFNTNFILFSNIMKQITHKSYAKTVLLAVCVNVDLMPDNGNGHLP